LNRRRASGRTRHPWAEKTGVRVPYDRGQP
jgi:hypothetical protein